MLLIHFALLLLRLLQTHHRIPLKFTMIHFKAGILGQSARRLANRRLSGVKRQQQKQEPRTCEYQQRKQLNRELR